ncbi:unnamed protein product [Amaranthus hypochondriacus]
MGSSFDDNGNSQPNEGTQFEESVDRTFDEDEDTRQPTKKQKNQRRATTSSRSNRSKWWDHYTVDELDPTIAHSWWKDQTKRYPILQKMAKDVLAIPISTVASESAFSTGGRILDDFRTSLTPKMAEALICAQDWLRKSRTPLAIEESLLALKEMEEGNALTLEHPEVIIDETLDTVEDD